MQIASLLPTILLAVAPAVLAKSESHPSSSYPGLAESDCQLRCPRSTVENEAILPAITQSRNSSGGWENTLECWKVNTVSTNLEGVDNAFRLDWEGGFDAAYQYIFDAGQSFMKSHGAPEPSLIVMGSGIGDLRMPSGRCLRATAGDVFFSVGTEGRMTAWWSQGTVVSDFFFKDGKIPAHEVVPEVGENAEGNSNEKKSEL